MARCEHCRGSGLAEKQGPDDDYLLDRVVLLSIEFNRLNEENERLRSTLTYVRDTSALDGLDAWVELCDAALTHEKRSTE